jgi:hypothetical protein
VRNSLDTSARQRADTEHGEDASTPATRHLCAGVYVDRRFRDLVIGKVHNDSRRRVAPSYGFDLVPVVRHAWLSWLLDLGQHVAIVGCALGGLARGGPVAVVIVGCAMSLCCLLCNGIPVGADLCRLQLRAWRAQFRRRNLRRRPESPMAQLQSGRRLLKCVAAGCVAIAAAPMVVANALDVSLGDAVPAARAMGFRLVVTAAVAGMLRQLLLNAVYHAGSLRPLTLTARERAIGEQQSHPCVVYQRPGFKDGPDFLDLFALDDVPTTFIGSGELVRRWPPLTVRLVRPGSDGSGGREHTRPPFRAHQLVQQLRSALEQVRMDEDPVNLRGLQVRDRIYIAETDVSCDRGLLSSDTYDLPTIIDEHQSWPHHFLEISVPSAGGEVVTTVFVRVTVKARCLSLDVATCALTRTREEFQLIDRFGEHGTSAVLRRALRSVWSLPAEVWQLWRLLGAPVVLARALWSVRDRTVVPRRGITVGPRVTVRQKAAEAWEDAILDRAIIYDHMSVIEKRILKTTEDFLEAHEVDTTVFRLEATRIINNSGVYNESGTTKIKASPIGTGAQAQFNEGFGGRDANGRANERGEQ